MLTLARYLNSSPLICGEVPGPGVAKVSLPRFFWLRARRSPDRVELARNSAPTRRLGKYAEQRDRREIGDRVVVERREQNVVHRKPGCGDVACV